MLVKKKFLKLNENSSNVWTCKSYLSDKVVNSINLSFLCFLILDFFKKAKKWVLSSPNFKKIVRKKAGLDKSTYPDGSNQKPKLLSLGKATSLDPIW